MDNTTPVIATTPGSRSIWITRSRVAKVFKRLRRENPSNSQKQLPGSRAEYFDRVDEEQSEDKSDISGITDIAYSDVSPWDDGKCKRKQHGEKLSPRFSHSSVPSSPSKSSNSTDPSFSQYLGTWCKLTKTSYAQETRIHPYLQLRFLFFCVSLSF